MGIDREDLIEAYALEAQLDRHHQVARRLEEAGESRARCVSGWPAAGESAMVDSTMTR